MEKEERNGRTPDRIIVYADCGSERLRRKYTRYVFKGKPTVYPLP